MGRLPDDNALLAGGPADFGIFYARHEDAMLAFFLRRTGSPELAADLTAETFARALEGRRRFDATLGAAQAWLFGIARHVLARSLERGRVEDEARHRLGIGPLSLSDDDLARIDELAGEPTLAALAGLPAEQRQAVEARVVGELEYAELAVRLQTSEAVVRQRVSRGLRTLRARLERRP